VLTGAGTKTVYCSSPKCARKEPDSICGGWGVQSQRWNDEIDNSGVLGWALPGSFPLA
jgi:hypothetical protein